MKSIVTASLLCFLATTSLKSQTTEPAKEAKPVTPATTETKPAAQAATPAAIARLSETPAIELNLSSKPQSVGFGDINGDGQTDMLISRVKYVDKKRTAAPGESNVAVLLQKEGTFALPADQKLSFQSHPGTAFVGDYDADKKADIAVMSRKHAFVVFGKDDFKTQTHIPLRSLRGFGITAPVTKKGAADFLIEGGLICNYDGKRKLKTILCRLPDKMRNFMPAVADLNRDGSLDVIYSGPGGKLMLYYGPIPVKGQLLKQDMAQFLVLETGSGIFKAPVTGDFNNDGLQDIAIATGEGIKVVLQDSPTGFAKTSKIIKVGSEPVKLVATADINGDKLADLLAVSKRGNRVEVYIQDKNKPFSAETVPTQQIKTPVENIYVADVNKDGKDDIVTAYYDRRALKGTVKLFKSSVAK